MYDFALAQCDVKSHQNCSGTPVPSGLISPQAMVDGAGQPSGHSYDWYPS